MSYWFLCTGGSDSTICWSATVPRVRISCDLEAQEAKERKGLAKGSPSLPSPFYIHTELTSVLFHYLYPVIFEEALMQERARAHSERAHAEQIGGI